VHDGKFRTPMSELGQPRSFGDVGSMSDLPESGRSSTDSRGGAAARIVPQSIPARIARISTGPNRYSARICSA
jgi:hypothetical protein